MPVREAVVHATIVHLESLMSPETRYRVEIEQDLTPGGGVAVYRVFSGTEIKLYDFLDDAHPMSNEIESILMQAMIYMAKQLRRLQASEEA